MSEANTPTSVEATCEGLIPGFRVWTLRAYQESEVIVEVSKDYGSTGNGGKYRDFVKLLAEKGYTLTDSQVNQLCSALNVDSSDVAGYIEAAVPYLSTALKAAKGLGL